MKSLTGIKFLLISGILTILIGISWLKGGFLNPESPDFKLQLQNRINSRLIPNNFSFFHEKKERSTTEITFSQSAKDSNRSKLEERCYNIEREVDIEFRFVNYLEFHFCKEVVTESVTVSFIILIIWLIVLFYMLWSTAEGFFVPALKQLSLILKLSPDIAGVTLLALGNGAPDIFAALSAVTSNAGSLGIGNLLGGGTLVMTVVISIVVLTFLNFTKKILVITTGLAFLRDLVFNFFLVLFLLGVAIGGKIYIWMPVLILLSYVVYLITVFWISKIEKDRKTNQLIELGSPSLSLSETTSKPGEKIHIYGENFFEHEQLSITFNSEKIKEFVVCSPDIICLTVPQIEEKDEKEKRGLIEIFFKGKRIHEHHLELIVNVDVVPDIDVVINDDSSPLLRIKKKVKDKLSHNYIKRFVQYINISTDWKEKPFWEKIIYIFVFPLIILRFLTLPSMKKIFWNRWWASLYPTTALLFFLFAAGEDIFVYNLQNGFESWMLVLIIGMILSILVFWSFDIEFEIGNLRLKVQFQDFLFLTHIFLAFLMSIVWIFIIANELISLLRALGFIMDLSEAIMGLTILAIGNSLADVIANTTVAKTAPEMAISASFATPYFNLICGIGLGYLLLILSKGTQKFPLDPLVLTAALTNMSAVVISMIWIPIVCFDSPKWGFSKGYAFVLCLLYVVFLITSLSLEIAGDGKSLT